MSLLVAWLPITYMSTPTAKRFRFSLITLVVAVNVAGVLVWANIAVHNPFEGKNYIVSPPRPRVFYGWPVPACARYIDVVPSPGILFGADYQWFVAGSICDTVFALGFIFGSGMVTEFLVRKFRKAKRHED